MCLACLTTSKRAYISTWETKDKKPVPAYQKLPYIVSGYRVHYSRFSDCLKSLFHWHNETLNVWTAILPLIYYIWQLVTIHTKYNYLEMKEKVVLTLYGCSACLSFFASSTFHLLNCMGESVALLTLRIDMVGIALLIGGSYLPCLYYAFYCDPTMCRIYTSIISVLTICASIMFIIPKFANGYKIFRIATFTSIAAFGVVIIVHVLSIRGDEEGIIRQVNMIFLMYGMYGAGVFFYATLLPEAYVPTGSADFVIHSHNIWHIFVFLGSFVHNWNIFEMIESGPKCLQ